MTGIKWKRMLAALCCAFIAISGGCANPSTSSGSSVSQESGIPASQETSETQAPSQMAESAYEPSAPSSSVPESQSKPPESGRPSVAWSSIDDILAGMSLRGKICQMLVLSPELLTGVSGVTAAGETTRQALVDMPVGGLILLARVIDEKSFAEIADEVGLSYKGTAAVYYRTLEKLRKLLRGEENEF